MATTLKDGVFVVKDRDWFEEHYELGEMIAPGATALVFSGQRKHCHLETRWKVALKFVWDYEIARQEANRLVNLEAHKGVVNLLDFFLLDRDVIRPYVVQKQEEIRASSGGSIVGKIDASEGPVGVLVMQYLRGKPLIRRTVPITEEEAHHPQQDAFHIKDLETDQWMRQDLAYPLTLIEKFGVLEQMVTYIAECHENGVVHADLHPQNIIYHHEKNQVTILDLGGTVTRGSPGWQTPEHLEAISRDRTHYETGVDIFLLGLFMHRLFESEPIAEIGPIAERCLGPIEQRPSASTLSSQLATLKRRHFKSWHERYAIPMLLTLLLCAIGWGVYLNYRGEPTLQERFGKDHGAAFVEAQLRESREEPQKWSTARKAMIDILQRSDTWPELRDNLVRGLARQNQETTPTQSLTPDTLPPIKAFVYHQGYPSLFLAGSNEWVRTGYWIGKSWYFAKIHVQEDAQGYPHFHMVFRTMDRQETMVPLPAPPCSFEVKDYQFTLFIYDADLLDLFWFANDRLQVPMVASGKPQPQVHGVLYYKDDRDLLSQLLRYTGNRENQGRITLRDIPDREYFFWSHSYIQLKDATLTDYFKRLQRHTPLTMGEGQELLEGVRFTATGHWAMWEEFITNNALAPSGLRCTVRDNTIHITRIEEDEEGR